MQPRTSLSKFGGDSNIFFNSLRNQVTVAKQRTMFQTQTQKAGETDVSHKDYVLTGGWKRGNTQYYPDLCTQFGMERSTGYP